MVEAILNIEFHGYYSLKENKIKNEIFMNGIYLGTVKSNRLNNFINLERMFRNEEH